MADIKVKVLEEDAPEVKVKSEAPQEEETKVEEKIQEPVEETQKEPEKEQVEETKGSEEKKEEPKVEAPAVKDEVQEEPQKDSTILYHQQNGHLVLMYDHLFMEQQALEQMEHMTALKTYYGLQ